MWTLSSRDSDGACGGYFRYNLGALLTRVYCRWLWVLAVGWCAWWMAGCAAPLGPGYLLEKQELRVEFAAGARTIHIEAEYRLRNTGNRPLRELEIILPAGRRVRIGPVLTRWDGTEIATDVVVDHPRNSVVRFAKAWSLGESHSLQISYDIRPPEPGSTGLTFASDAFYLPASGWSPALPQPRGLFGFGGVPPKNWDLLITVPEGFTIHSSGVVKKTQRAKSGGETFRVRQTVDDRYPFVVAGKYSATEIRNAHQKIILWTRESEATGVLQQASTQISGTINAYATIFGTPPNRKSTFWIVECPVVDGCFSNFNSSISRLLTDNPSAAPSSELVSSDTVMVDTDKGAPQLAAAAGPALAASWLGYGRNPGFFEQTEPMALLPIFAAARSREQIDGPQARGETIRHVLRLVPQSAAGWPAAAPSARSAPRASALFAMPHAGPPESGEVLRAKSLLFFYALQDRYGEKVFHDAIGHMLYARAARGFDLDDLIAAFEAEVHQNVAEFVRHWMKRPGVPADFRARYESSQVSAWDEPRIATGTSR
jgi:hypothetical protein